MAVTANPRRGWRVDIDPKVTLTRTEAGRFSLPVVIQNDDERVSELDLVLTGEQIELIYANMRSLIAAGFPVREPPPQSRRAGLDL